jgi:hypothetical protein
LYLHICDFLAFLYVCKLLKKDPLRNGLEGFFCNCEHVWPSSLFTCLFFLDLNLLIFFLTDLSAAFRIILFKSFAASSTISLGTDHLTWRGGYGFLFRSEFFLPDNTRVRIFIFFVAQSAIFFLQNSTLGYWQKLSIRLLFFSSTIIRIFFSAWHWESEYFF